MKARRGAVVTGLVTLLLLSASAARASAPSSVVLQGIPSTVTWGQPVALSGFVSCGDQPMFGVPVVLRLVAPDGVPFDEFAASTDTQGAFSVADYPRRSAFVQAFVPAAGDCAEGASEPVLVRVRPGVHANAPRIGYFGRAVSIAGAVAPSHAGGFVDLEILDGARGRWRYVKTTRLSRFSTYRFGYVNQAVTPYLLFRVVFRGDLDHAPNVSRNLRIDWLFPRV